MATPWPPHGHVLMCTGTPTPPCPGSARPGAGAGSSRRQGPGQPGAVAPALVALGVVELGQGTGMAPHPVYERWREGTRSKGMSGIDSRGTEPSCTSPMGRDTPNQGWGSP